MRLVILESPYAGDAPRNLAYARACMADCLARGESPYASHLLYTQPGVLDDSKPDERALGMAAGFAWGERADATVVYTDLGTSAGMVAGIERATVAGRAVELRTLAGWGERPCEALFERLVTEDPERLIGMLAGDALRPALLTFAAASAGLLPIEVCGPSLVELLKHPSALVREGAVYGLQEHRDDVRFSVAEALRAIAEDDPSPGVRMAAGGER